MSIDDMVARRQADNLRRYRAEAVAAGLCQQCRCRPQKPGRKTCIDCLVRGKRDKTRLTAERRAAALCACGRRPTRGFATCGPCRRKFRTRGQARTAQYVNDGRCRRCGAEPRPDIHFCQRCIDTAARFSLASRQRNRAAGLCGCGRQRVDGFKSCARCRDYQRAYYVEHRRAT